MAVRDGRTPFFLACLAITVAVVGCNRQPKTVRSNKTTKSTASSTQAASQQMSAAHVDALVTSSLEMLTTSTVQRTDFVTAIKQLEDSLAQRYKNREEITKSLDDAKAQRMALMLGTGTVLRARDEKFDPLGDSLYLRDALFLQRIAKRQAEERGTPLDQARRLFSWATDYVQWVPDGAQPETVPTVVCLRGTGTTAERSWVFLDLLRQANLAGCMVAVASPSKPESDLAWLCGVILENQVYLFDPRLGLPVPSAKGSVATLSELAADPRRIEALLAEPTPAYPVRPEQAKGFRLLVPLQPESIAPRMEFLEGKLGGAVRAILYQDFDRVVARAEAALALIPGNRGIGPWTFPTDVAAQWCYQSPAADMTTISILDQEVFNCRLQQLLGEHEAAIERLVRLDRERTAESMTLNLSVIPDAALRQQLVSKTLQDICYFVGLSKLDSAPPEPETARSWFDRYLRQFSSESLSDVNLVDWGRLCKDLVRHGPAKEPSASRRIWTLLDEETRRLVGQVAAGYDESLRVKGQLQQLRKISQDVKKQSANMGEAAALDPSEMQALEVMLQGLQPEADRWSALERAARPRLLAGLNRMVNSKDFYTADDFRPVISNKHADPQLVGLVQKPRDAMTPQELARFNRLLLSSAFPGEISRSRSPWQAGAILHTAKCLHVQGKTEAAIAWLRKDYPDLEPLQQAALKALAKSWQRPS